MDETVKVEGLTAFWPGDEFPFYLNGVVTEINKHGRVQTLGYGPGFWFEPTILLPTSSAIKIAEELDTLRKEYNLAIAKVDSVYFEKVGKVTNFPHK